MPFMEAIIVCHLKHNTATPIVRNNLLVQISWRLVGSDSTVSLRRHVFSFYSLIDLFSILPTYIAFLFSSAQYLLYSQSVV